jgi:hypothetical protein
VGPCPEQSLAKPGSVERGGTPCFDRGSSFGDCVIDPRFGRCIGSAEAIEHPAEEMRDAHGIDQRQVEALEGVAPGADLTILENRRSAQILDFYRLAQELRPQRCGVAGTKQRNGVVGEPRASVGNRPPDRRRQHDAQADLGDAPRGGVKRVPGIERPRNADDRHGVTGKDEAIGGPVPGVLRAEGTEPDPQGETAEEEDALLGAKGDEEERHDGADHRPDNAIEALRQYLPALLRLRDDENGEQGPIGLIEIEGEGDEQGDQSGSRRFGREDPRNPVGPGKRSL